MIRILLLVTVSLFFVSCATHPRPISPNEKAFEGEDLYIMLALNAELTKHYDVAARRFEELYDKASKKEYLYRSLHNYLVAKENEKVIEKVDEITQGTFSDPALIRLKIIALMEMGKLDYAKKLSIALAKKTQKAEDYLLASDVYIKNQEFDVALKYLNSAYMKEYNEKILDKMAIILYVNLHRKKDAIAYLETHTRMHGCSQLICNRLIGIYSNENNIEGLLSVYKRLYSLKKDKSVAQKIIRIYAYKRDYVKLIDFLEETHADDTVLLELYMTGKNYEKASALAQKLYEKSGDIKYLGQSAIYEYEAHSKKMTKKLLASIVKKLTKVAKETDEPLYLNYLGYILIDHDLDVKKGMDYIKKVLKTNPDSAFYLDSLAWGYYKLGKCVEAKKVMDRVVNMEGGDNPEVLLHVKKIDACYKKSLEHNKGKKKR
ncbi:hypothetical protein FJR45_08760 [Sulfurimonas sediminis]|uniref:ATP-dependent nuclease subunit B n=1 Tax=Sulfurimonas sediminis TaxID=2590020 RepID=A0A7M1B5L0_9BACT|nr:hypothetical protein [Sulfurimonas sediminis]QOP44028.1 hypothetical protein FJR45_08760 [Sulfurimonas sediminis]